MTGFRVVLARLAAYIWRRRHEAALNEEIQAHLDLLAAQHMRNGMSPAAARAAARRDFGGVEAVKDVYRDQLGLPFIDTLAQDLRYAIRTLQRDAGFASVAVFSIALGIAGNVAIFTLINAVLLRPLPVAAPEQLRLFTITGPQSAAPGTIGARSVAFSYPLYEQFRGTPGSFSTIAASGGYAVMRFSDSGGQVERIEAERVTGNFFDLLGVRAIAGRTFTSDDDHEQQPSPVVVISDNFWARRFGRDPAAIGRSITLDDVAFTIVGAAPPGFHGFRIDRKPDLRTRNTAPCANRLRRLFTSLRFRTCCPRPPSRCGPETACR